MVSEHVSFSSDYSKCDVLETAPLCYEQRNCCRDSLDTTNTNSFIEYVETFTDGPIAQCRYLLFKSNYACVKISGHGHACQPGTRHLPMHCLQYLFCCTSRL